MISGISLLLILLFAFNSFSDVMSNQLYLQPEMAEHGYFTNDGFFITCITTGDTSNNLAWIGTDDSEIKEKDGRIHVESAAGNGQGLRLVVEKVQKDDEGQYVCRDDKESKSFSLSVYTSISFGDTPKVQQAPEGENALITCHAKADPPPVVSWFFNGASLVQTERIQIDDNGVTIHNVNRSDAGIYKCNALTTTHLATQMKVIDISFRVQYKPEFTDDSESVVYASIGLLANLSCTVSADPAPKFEWMRNGSLIHNGSDFMILHNETRSVLQFMVNDRSQFGEYTCEAGNELGFKRKIIKLEEGDTPKAPHLEVASEGEGTLILGLHAQEEEDYERGRLEVTGFKVEYILASGTWDQANFQEFDIVANHKYILNNISYNTEYHLRAAARNKAGYGEYSEVKSYITQPLQVSPMVNDEASTLATPLFFMIFGACVLWAFN